MFLNAKIQSVVDLFFQNPHLYSPKSSSVYGVSLLAIIFAITL
jgi:hypothetical protein